MINMQEELFSKHTQIEEIKIINWGVFNGQHTLRPATGNAGSATTLTGKGGSGKSNIIDAMMFVLGDTRRNDFNKRAGTGGGKDSSRNILTYTRGYLKDKGTGNSNNNYLRQAPCWSGVSITAVTSDNSRFTIARFTYLETNQSQIKYLWAFKSGTFDIALADNAMRSAKGFTEGSLKSAIGADTVSKNGTLVQGLWQKATGCTQDSGKLHRLLYDPEDLRTPADIFKNLYADENSSIAAAEATVKEYDKFCKTKEKSEKEIKKNRAIADLESKYNELEIASAELLKFGIWAKENAPSSSDEECLQKWIIQKGLPILEAETKAAAVDFDEKEAVYKTAESNKNDQLERVKDIEGQIRSLGVGQALTERELELKNAIERKDNITRNRNTVLEAFRSVNENIPNTEESWIRRMSITSDFSKNAGEKIKSLEEQRDSLLIKKKDAEKERDTAKSRLLDAQGTGHRVPREMMTVLNTVKQATGVEDGAIVYAAQLFDLKKEYEDWRPAVNAAWGSEARTILVDADEKAFRKKLESIHYGNIRRFHFRFVDTKRERRILPSSNNTLSSKLRFDETSRFTPYIKQRLLETDYFCANTPDEFKNTDEKQITLAGQVKSGRDGWYGKGGDSDIIGFTDKTYIKTLEDCLFEYNNALMAIRDEENTVKSDIEKIRRELSLWNTCKNFNFRDINTDNADQEVKRINEEIKRLKEDQSLKSLTREREIQTSVYAELDEKSKAANTNLVKAKEKLELYTNSLSENIDKIKDFDSSGVPGSAFEDAFNRLGFSKEDLIQILTDRNRMMVKAGAVEKSVIREITRLQNSIASKKDAVTSQMAFIKTEYMDQKEAAGFGTDIGSYPAYLSCKSDGDTEGNFIKYRAEYLSRTAQLFMTFRREVEEYEGKLRQQADDLNKILSQDNVVTAASQHLELRLKFTKSEQHKELIRMIDDYRLKYFYQAGTKDLCDIAYFENLKDDGCDEVIEKVKMIIDRLRIKDCRSPYTDPRENMTVDVVLYDVVNGEHAVKENVNFAGNNGSKYEHYTTTVLAAAICFAVGHTHGLPNYAPLFMDEAFVLSDEKHTAASIRLLKDLGFQVILSCPEQKANVIIQESQEAYMVLRDDDESPARIWHMGNIEEYEEAV